MDVAVRFQEKDATVRYLPGKVGLAQILKRYDDTPFGVTPDGPVVSIAKTKQLTLRGWSNQVESPAQAAGTPTKETEPDEASRPIEVWIELISEKTFGISPEPHLSLADSQSTGLELLGRFEHAPPAEQSADKTSKGSQKSSEMRLFARLAKTVALKPGEITVPFRFHVPMVDAENRQHDVDGTLQVVVQTPEAPQPVVETTTGVALIGGSLELRLGHLCDQTGCVEHFHKSLAEFPCLAAVRPQPSLESPSALVHLRAQQPVDIWHLRQKLRKQGVEAVGMVARGMTSCRMRVELHRWKIDKSSEASQCLVCRDNSMKAIEELPWVKDVELAGGGINFRPVNPESDLIELLEALARIETAPHAVWLLPQGAPMPKVSPPLVAKRDSGAKQGGSNVHPVVEFHFGHTCDVGTDVLSVLGKRDWLSRTHAENQGETTIARAAIGDRKFANLTSLTNDFQSAGHMPRHLRLSDFGDIRIQIEFAHICGEVEFSKPPKTKKKKEEPNDSNKEGRSDAAAPEKPSAPQPDVGQAPQSNEKTDKKSECCSNPKPKKPFIPKPLRPAKSSHGRKAIEAALNGVEWIQQATFLGYHTKPEFTGPRKLTLSLQAEGEDVVPIEQLMGALNDAGFPPKTIIVSRRFPGIPFRKQLPVDLQVTDRQGKRLSLSSMQKSGQPLTVAFVSLKCPRHKKYEADPKLYDFMAKTIDKYKDRVGFVAVSANPEDKFDDVVEFWEKTGLSIPLLHDADGQVRSVFNSQATPPPHMFVFDGDARLRYAGDPHDNWEKPKQKRDDFLGRALELVLAGEYQPNGSVFYKAAVCNCSDPNCKCPKCGCGPTCRCTINH